MISKKAPIFICMTILMLSTTFILSGCTFKFTPYSVSYTGGFTTEWGTEFKYEIDPSWQTIPSRASDADKSFYNVIAYANDDYFVSIQTYNPAASQQRTATSYQEWVNYMKNYTYNPNLKETYSDMSINTLGTTYISGEEFTICKTSYKVSHPDLPAPKNIEAYHAVLKTNKADVDIAVSNRDAFEKFVNSMEIQW